MIAEAGLALISLGWLIQLYFIVGKKDPKVNMSFAIVYAVGALVLAYVGYTAASWYSMGLNVLAAVLALAVGFLGVK